MSKYRIKIKHFYNKSSEYIPQVKWLWFWLYIDINGESDIKAHPFCSRTSALYVIDKHKEKFPEFKEIEIDNLDEQRNQ